MPATAAKPPLTPFSSSSSSSCGNISASPNLFSTVTATAAPTLSPRGPFSFLPAASNDSGGAASGGVGVSSSSSDFGTKLRAMADVFVPSSSSASFVVPPIKPHVNDRNPSSGNSKKSKREDDEDESETVFKELSALEERKRTEQIEKNVLVEAERKRLIEVERMREMEDKETERLLQIKIKTDIENKKRKLEEKEKEIKRIEMERIRQEEDGRRIEKENIEMQRIKAEQLLAEKMTRCEESYSSTVIQSGKYRVRRSLIVWLKSIKYLGGKDQSRVG